MPETPSVGDIMSLFCLSLPFNLFFFSCKSVNLIIRLKMDIFQMVSSLFMLLCSTVGIVCSFVFIIVVIIDRQCRTTIILVPLNTTIAGLIINIIFGCQAIYQMLNESDDVLCPFQGFLLHSSTGLFYHTLCIQSLYRLSVTAFAQRRFLQSKTVILSSIIIQWFISITFGIPILLLGRIIYQENGRICQVFLTKNIFYSNQFSYLIRNLLKAIKKH